MEEHLQVFNYGLSRACSLIGTHLKCWQQSSEYSERPISADPDEVTEITKAACSSAQLSWEGVK